MKFAVSAQQKQEETWQTHAVWSTTVWVDQIGESDSDAASRRKSERL